jgi:hypothetical protein
MENKFNFNEVVKVISKQGKLKEIFGRIGPISAMGQSEETGRWSYSITFPEGNWFVFEDQIESTGRFVPPEDLSLRPTIKVIVDSKGYGRLKDESTE